MDEIKLIDAYLKATGMTESRLGILSCGNAYAVERIRSGGASLATFWAVEDYIKLHPVKPACARKAKK